MFRTIVTRPRPTLFLKQPVPIPIAKNVLFHWDSVALNGRSDYRLRRIRKESDSKTLIAGIVLRPITRKAILCFRHHLIWITVHQFRKSMYSVTMARSLLYKPYPQSYNPCTVPVTLDCGVLLWYEGTINYTEHQVPIFVIRNFN